VDKMRMESVDLTQKNIEKIYELFPSVVTEKRGIDGKIKKAVNFELLKQILADEVVEGDEAYEFTWVGKKEAIAEAGRPIKKTLRPCKEDSKEWDTTENIYIEGDNLQVLKLLQESYLKSINLIYIDPPYNTGKDFIYPDNFLMNKETYDESSNYFNENGEINFSRLNNNLRPRFHSDWCSMIYSRLLLARNLLTDDGAIFISIDENEDYNLREMCDEVFGEDNFVAEFVWSGGQKK
jgi:adenine-specific DNA-methyltransferase